MGVGPAEFVDVQGRGVRRRPHLGIHTELGSPGLAKLWERGILDGSRARLSTRHKAVAVAWTGCDGEDLNIIRDNPAFELYDPDYLLNPLLMGAEPRR